MTFINCESYVFIRYVYAGCYFIRIRIHVNFIKVSHLFAPVLKDDKWMCTCTITQSFLSLMFLDCQDHKTPFGTNAINLAIIRVSSIDIPLKEQTCTFRRKCPPRRLLVERDIADRWAR